MRKDAPVITVTTQTQDSDSEPNEHVGESWYTKDAPSESAVVRRAAAKLQNGETLEPREIGALLGISNSAASGHLKTALRKVRRVLVKEGFELEDHLHEQADGELGLVSSPFRMNGRGASHGGMGESA